MHRASLCALTATVAKRIIDHGKIVGNLDGTVGTNLLTLHTSDTTVGAALSCNRTLLVIGALHNNLRGVVDELDHVIGAGADTYAASDTFLRVYVSNTVLNAYSLFWADFYTVAIAKAGIYASLVAIV